MAESRQQFRFRFQQVKRGTVGFRQGRREGREEEKGGWEGRKGSGREMVAHLMARRIDGTPSTRWSAGSCDIVWLHLGLERDGEKERERGGREGQRQGEKR